MIGLARSALAAYRAPTGLSVSRGAVDWAGSRSVKHQVVRQIEGTGALIAVLVAAIPNGRVQIVALACHRLDPLALFLA